MLARATTTVRSAWARGLRPDPVVTTDVWAERHRRVASETSPKPGRWRNETTPYLVEPMREASPSGPHRRVTVKGSSQVGKSEVGNNWIGTIVDTAPGPTLVVYPTVELAKDWVAEKFDPTVRATPNLRAKVREAKSRDAGGSTAKRKRFPGGFLMITGANSTRGLRMKSIRYVYKDEWSDWPDDVDGQGDPDKMADARQIAYEAAGQAKTLEISTPTNKGACRISDAYDASDQRRFLVPCPHCGHRQWLRFRPGADGRGGLHFQRQAPYAAWYACAANGCVIEHHEKEAMVAAGRWEAQNPGPGRHPGFHIWVAYSPFTPWDRIAQEFLKCKDDPQQLKGFVNLWLGEEWEESGEAPDWVRLKDRAEDYPLGVVPAAAGLLTIGVDVQKNGVYYEVVAWGLAKTSWSIEFGFLEGDPFVDPMVPASAGEKPTVWQQLSELWDRPFATAGGLRRLKADLVAIDAGFATHQVYMWCRARPRAMAVKGVPGWEHDALGEARPQDINWRGRRIKRGVMLHPVHVWNLWGEFYTQLRKEPPGPGHEAWPAGYCHHSRGHTEGYYRQLTAAFMTERETRGRTVREWTAKGDNHYHSARIYAMAAWVRAARRAGVLYHDPAVFQALIAERHGGPPRPQPELPLEGAAPPRTSPPALARPPGESATTTQATPAPPAAGGRGWLPRRTGWLR